MWNNVSGDENGGVSVKSKFYSLGDLGKVYGHQWRNQNGVDQISILGYCMGGTFSVMYTALHSEKVKNLILMAAPLDFHVDTGLLHVWADKRYFNADKIVEVFGNVPGELLNMGFTLLDPINNTYLKYLNFVDIK